MHVKNQLIFPLFALIILSLFACKPKNTGETGSTESVSPDTLKYEIRKAVKRHCVNDEQCADFNIFYLNVAGNNVMLAGTVKMLVQMRTLAGLGGNPNSPFELALDSIGLNFIEEFIQLKRDMPSQTFNQTMQVTSNVLLNNPKIMTTRIDFFTFTGGAHPNTASALMSFDLKRDGYELKIADLVKDTAAVLPMLEKAYKEAKQMQANDDISKLLLSGKSLPFPANIGVVPQGILFVYNDYEVASHAVGPADILLTWEQLGDLADKTKWLQ